MFPMLLAAGAIQVDAWLGRGSRRLRGRTARSGDRLQRLGVGRDRLSSAPRFQDGSCDRGRQRRRETIGWPDFAATIAAVYQQAGQPAVICTPNYGEAGAVDRFVPALGLPQAYSGHNAFAEWGRPPNRPGPVLAVGLGDADLAHFAGCRVAASVTNSAGVNNDERGTPIDPCTGTRGPWSQIWGSLRHLG